MARTPGARPRILLVEADPVFRFVLAHDLSGLGAEVLVAADGPDAFRLLTDEILTLDLLVTGLVLPGLDGLTLVRVVRAEGGEQDLSILVACEGPPADVENRLRSLHASVVDRRAGSAAVAAEARAALELRGWLEPAPDPWAAPARPAGTWLPRRLSRPTPA